MSVPKIIKITTYVIYQWRLCKEFVGGKVNNASGFNLRRNFAFARTPSVSPRVITWLEPAIQSKTLYLVNGRLKKNTRDLDELLIWARDMVKWYWSADTFFWQLSINHNMDVQYQSYTHDNCATLLFFKEWGLAYGRTSSHVTTKIFEIDRLPNFLRYGAPLSRPRRAEAPLILSRQNEFEV